MRKLGIILFVLAALGGCENKRSTPQMQAEGETSKSSSMTQEDHQKSCICTKEYDPVCDSHGQSWPNKCQALCDGVKDVSPCP